MHSEVGLNIRSWEARTCSGVLKKKKGRGDGGTESEIWQRVLACTAIIRHVRETDMYKEPSMYSKPSDLFGELGILGRRLGDSSKEKYGVWEYGFLQYIRIIALT
jgi:hypothetical protein